MVPERLAGVAAELELRGGDAVRVHDDDVARRLRHLLRGASGGRERDQENRECADELPVCIVHDVLLLIFT